TRDDARLGARGPRLEPPDAGDRLVSRRVLCRLPAALARPRVSGDVGGAGFGGRPRARARVAPAAERAVGVALDCVAKAYPTHAGRKIVLEDATAEFASGHNYGILGANGVGKSTLIRLLAGSEMPDRGRISRDARVSFPLGYGGTFHGALAGRENV